LKGEYVLQTLKKVISLFTLLVSIIWVVLNSAHAEVIDRIQINQAGDEAEIQIRFVPRIQFLRQVMLKNGDVRLYFNLLETDTSDKKIVYQRKDSPPSNIVPHFTITYPEIDKSLTISFGKELKSYYIRPGNDGRSISFFTPIDQSAAQIQTNAPAAKSSATTIPPVTPSTPAVKRTAAEIELTEAEAKQLKDNADTMQRSNLIAAQAAMLRKLVNLPPNKYTKESLLTLGQIDEKLGDFDKARADYLAFMTLYPKAREYSQMEEGVSRMIMAAYANKKSVPEQIVAEDKTITFGGFSQNFYRGIAQTDIRIPVVFSSNIVDQSQLVSALELTSMSRSASSETRFVLRDSFTKSFLQTVGSNNFLDAAYVEQTMSDQSYFYGLGRQTGASGGTPSRFDGAWLGHNFNDAWRVNGTVGQPSRFSGSTEEIKTFAAINVALTRKPGEWSGNTYLISQRVGKFTDKRALGVEAHFYDGKSNHTALMEYDTLFKTLNFGSFQGNWITADDDNYTLLLDHRRSPTLQATNALFRERPLQTVANLGILQATLLTNALLASPIINQFDIGLTRPFSPKVKFGGDIRVANTTSFEAYDFTNSTTVLLQRKTIPSVTATTLSGQLIGTNLWFDNDLGIASASYTNANTYKAKSLSFSQVATLQKDWRLDLSLLLYAENNALATIGVLTRISPTFKVTYQLSTTKNLELGAGVEQSRITNTTLDSKTRRKFFNVGYRWDFQ
jgi:tetratricopeptide (TPR) repeat protein